MDGTPPPPATGTPKPRKQGLLFQSVELERRNGLPVFVQPRHVASLEPLGDAEVAPMYTRLTLANGFQYELTEPPSVVRKKLESQVGR
jgi:hypothetical protein